MSVTLNANALTTLAEAKRYLRLKSSADDDLIVELINAMSDRIERVTGRLFNARDYREFYRPNAEKQLVLKQRPVLDLYRVGWGIGDAIQVQYTGTDVNASCWVNNDGVNLRSVAASGTATPFEDTFATNPTMSTMATALTARAGWTVTNQVTNDAESYDLHRISIPNAKTNAVMLTWPDEILDDYIVDLDTGIIQYHQTFGNVWPDSAQRFGRAFQTFMVHYRAGYATIPDGLSNVAARWVARAFHGTRTNPHLQSESLGDYSYTMAGQLDTDDALRDDLRQWMDIAVSMA